MFKMPEQYSKHGIYFKLVFISLFISFSHQEPECVSTHTSTSGEIKTPNYPNSYPRHLSCEWHISVANNSSILLVFKDFFTFQTDYLVIYEDMKTNLSLVGNYSERNYPKNFVSKYNQLVLKFSTKSHPRKGFDIHYETIEHGCGGSLKGKENLIKSPGYPHRYYENMNCEWTVECPENRTIILKFNDFQLENHHAHLLIYDRISMTVIANLSGDGLPSDLITRTNRLTIRFRSDQSSKALLHKGFSLSYSSLIMGSNNVPPMIIMATNTIIRAVMDPKQTLVNTYTSVPEYRIIDYDLNRKKPILWDPQSYRLVVDFPEERTAFTIHSRTAECLTYDPIHGILFWIDMQYNTINAMDIKEEVMATLLELESHHSTDLLVNIQTSELIWSEISSTDPKISQIECDGTKRTTLYSRGRQASHLTADYRTKRYYFVDITDYSLISIDFFGQNEISLMTSSTFFDSVISMSLSNNDLYLSNNQIIFRVSDVLTAINRAEVLFTTRDTHLNSWYTKSELFYQIKPLNVKRNRIFGFKLIDEDLFVNTTNNKCLSAKCSGFCLPNSISFRCIGQSLTAIPSPISSIDSHQDSNVLTIFNSVFIVLLIGIIVLATFYLSQRITKLDNQFNQVIKPCATFIRDSNASDISHVYANNEYEDPVYIMRNNRD